MRQAIRAIGWAIYVLWLVVIVFTVTAVYSAFQLGVDFRPPETSTSGGTISLLLPFSVDNKGFYDISNLNITTVIHESSGASVANTSTVVPLISSGNRVNATHKISISLENMTTDSLSRLLFNDTNLNIDLSLALEYARVIPLQISTNFTMPWGAPLYNLTLGTVAVSPYNSTHVRATLPLSFENHSFFSLNGTVQTEIRNTSNQKVGGSTTPISAQPQSGVTTIQLIVFFPLTSVSSFKEVRLYFDTSGFSYGPVVIPIG
jgi:hypothetical protein